MDLLLGVGTRIAAALVAALVAVLLIVFVRLRSLRRRVDALDERLDHAGIAPPPPAPRSSRPRRPRISVLP
ncbi:hypothetical protein IP92_05541 [Pseudoduganella flava]|uniref:Uncharacterized protein n=1 Tax=Pseudoduganella flava TaxID=871742 RepID=A0A562PCK5_9BURK|nr:hypothetical protein [Pseudoduganella flava]QGZ40102.1 hypothetical protein GO485_14215 [Pseudoduganella flava]TWI42149.1 hypothetical protein IP92_05541 [Pseudoduganella flava]